METKAWTVNGVEFVLNNYAAILEKTGVDVAFHLLQDLLRVSVVGFVFPTVVSGAQVLEFWETAQFDDGSDTGTPSIIFSHDGEEKFITPQTVRDAFYIPTHDFYTMLVGDEDMSQFLTLIGYEGSLAKLG